MEQEEDACLTIEAGLSLGQAEMGIASEECGGLTAIADRSIQFSVEYPPTPQSFVVRTTATLQMHQWARLWGASFCPAPP